MYCKLVRERNAAADSQGVVRVWESHQFQWALKTELLVACPPTHPLLLLLPFRNRSLTLLSIREPIASPGNDASLNRPAERVSFLSRSGTYSLPLSSLLPSDIKTDTQREGENKFHSRLSFLVSRCRSSRLLFPPLFLINDRADFTRNGTEL